jgi:hypothetical protein
LVVTVHLLDTRHESLWVLSQTLKRHDCDGIAQEFQVLETAMVLEL